MFIVFKYNEIKCKKKILFHIDGINYKIIINFLIENLEFNNL